MTTSSTDFNVIAANIAANLPEDRRNAYTAETEFAAKLLADLNAGRRELSEVVTILSGSVFSQIQALLPANKSLIKFADSQFGDVKIGDVTSGNIYKNNVIFTTPSWNWGRYGEGTLNWLEELINDIKDELRPALRERWQQVDWIVAADTYRKELGRLYGSMQIFGMHQSIPLSDIFTDVYLLDKPSAWRRHSIEQLSSRSNTYAELAYEEERREGGELIEKHSRVFILGQPGSGKTTFLKHLTIEAVEGKIDALPIFVSLKEWSDKGISLMAFIVERFTICNFPDARLFIEQILSEGRAIVLFDGLDEVVYEHNRRQIIMREVREFTYKYKKSKVVLTCRTAANEYIFEQFVYCELANFSERQINTFVRRWFQKDKLKQDMFLKSLAESYNERLRDLARRPLLLTMLCLTFEETMEFPQRRAELYEEATNVLLKKWDSSRSIQRDQVYRKLSVGYKRQLLNEIAIEAFEKGEFFISKRKLAGRVARFLQYLPPADQTEYIDGEIIISSIEAQHGLLIERAQNIYSFSHLTFHEYFAARYITDHADDRTILATVAQGVNPQWREVLLLTASMLDRHKAKRFF